MAEQQGIMDERIRRLEAMLKTITPDGESEERHK
jgi:hypothetical protein